VQVICKSVIGDYTNIPGVSVCASASAADESWEKHHDHAGVMLCFWCSTVRI
jgi:hypothetical protein